jgi:putative transcriptional regulator
LIVYQDILGRLSRCGWSTVRLQRERMISNGTIIQIRAGRPISTRTVDTICRLCGCQPGDFLLYVPDEQKKEEG